MNDHFYAQNCPHFIIENDHDDIKIAKYLKLLCFLERHIETPPRLTFETYHVLSLPPLTIMNDPLQKEFEYFLANLPKLLPHYRGKVLVIKDCIVQGSYSSEPEAVREGVKKFKLGTFLVQLCSDDESSYTRTFRSRVAFAA